MLFQRRNRDILQFRNSFLFQFCHDRDPLLDQRFREAPLSAFALSVWCENVMQLFSLTIVFHVII